MSQSRGITKKNPLREDSLRYAHEFGHAAFVTANGGQLCAHDRVYNPLHGSENQAWWLAFYGAGVVHGRQGNQIPDFFTVGVTEASSLCKLLLSIQPAARVRTG